MFSEIILKNKKIIDKSFSESDFLDLLLKNRQIKKSDYDDFFKPHFPIDLDFNVNKKELKNATNRVNLAIKNNENILIYGDYDVDGITATAILWQVLYQKGAKVLPFIPDREADGYGIKSKSFFDFETQKKIHFDLLITVDNGIVANLELEKIAKKNTDIIIVDHHLPTEDLPKVSAIIHSTDFSGAALSWFFSTQFDKNADIGLAAAGTVADCLPLVSINRSIVVHGLKSLRKNPNHGLKKLIEVSGIKQDSVSAYDLGFVIGPRINAVGRLSNPTEALRLLCSQNSIQADKYAQNLDKFNKDRQDIQKENLKIAEEIISRDVLQNVSTLNKKNVSTQNKLIFISHKEFLPGIIGLIAGRLTEKYYLPSIIISVGDEYSKGSCRSIKELNIVESLRQFNDDLVDLGGHAGAAGFTIKTTNIKKFQNKITDYINQQLKDIDLKPTIIVESEMKLSAVNIKNCRLIGKLEPFGIDNTKPLFLFKNLRIIQKRVLGSTGDHLKLKLDDPNTNKLENIPADAIAFKKGDLDNQFQNGDLINIIASLDLNIWNGQTSPQLIVKEIFT
ncbi:MAG: single-stranded-DNA-specific exonuclease RecJ [Candidatus Shapirobacteria bacterium]|nr:single-stranded-DNA-specific exonuclease RecJ [Candidatus Shapirobacteria bacterium]MDD3002990.1 single-stranded-DNA-specific exonuclease RecJ [Candidatus Shapirobacteria bacterium]MDD4383142.1 single-stranded-DNA-specific exonuclease RecJ [Candidatus Shapirobacteria bacterium]